jgi:hypothetical protein
LGEGDDVGLKDDKELFNKEIYKKDKEQGQNELAVLLFRLIPPSRTDGLGGGMTIEKISSPPYFKVGKIGASAPAELKLDPRLLQGTKMRKISRRTQTNTRKHKGNVIITHRQVSRAASSPSSSSSRISTALPSEEKGGLQ